MSNPDPTEVNLCAGCGTMKHLNADNLCGRCADSTAQELQNEIATIILMDFHTRVMNYPRGKIISADAEAAKIVALFAKRQAKAVREARIDENQQRLDKIIAWENRKPVPGELTSASFGSAGVGLEIAGFKQGFEKRIATLKANEEK